MRILYVVPYTPNLIHTRPYNLVRHLLRLGHQVTLATLWGTEAEREQLSELEQQGIHVAAFSLPRARSFFNCAVNVGSSVPFQAVYCWQPRLWREIERILSDPARQLDIVHVEHLRGAVYGTRIGKRLPVVWDSVDCISHLFKQAAQSSRSPFGRLAGRLELGRTRPYEARLAREFDKVLVTSDLDKSAFGELLTQYPSPSGQFSDRDQVQVLRNGVDLEYFRPIPFHREDQTLIYSGKMSYHANVTSALYLIDQVMPRVWQAAPQTQLKIVGQNPPAELRALARRDPDRILVTGTVPDIRPYLGRATVAVAPIRYGAGIQNKVLEAMAMGVPVVATSKAVSALSIRSDEHAVLADDPESFAGQILRVLSDPALQNCLAINGRRYVEAQHDWRQITHQLEGIYRSLVLGAN